MKRESGGKAHLMVYTRQATDSYPQGLAYSIHFAISRCGSSYDALNSNYGILFAESTVGPDQTIHAKALKHPWIFPMPGGGYGIMAVRINEDGSADEESRGKALLFTTLDFMQFKELGLLSLHADVNAESVRCRYDSVEKRYHIEWVDTCGTHHFNTTKDICSLSTQPTGNTDYEIKNAPAGMLPEGAVMGNMVAISGNLCDRIALYWNKLTCTKLCVPERICVKTAADLEAVQATAVYSDGSTTQKPIIWETGALDLTKPGTYRVRGTFQSESYDFPLARGYGDPVVFSWEGRSYFISTNDNENDIGLYVRESKDTAELFHRETRQHLILGRDETRGLIQTFWAPEFHVIGDALYILFAVSGKQWGPQCHVMKLKKGGRITDPAGWENPVRVQRKDGGWLAEDGITLDMTYLNTAGRSYMIWSYRKNIGTQLDTGSMLYIAAVDPSSPWCLTSEQVLLSRPLYGWENVNHTINNEGPCAFQANNRIYLTYSGGSSNSFTYALGLLTADADADLLDKSVWKKRGTPVLSFYSVSGEYGPGHNSFFTDERSNLMMAYHAEEAIDSDIRCIGIRRVHFNIHNEPLFDMSAEEVDHPVFSNIETDVVLCPSD